MNVCKELRACQCSVSLHWLRPAVALTQWFPAYAQCNMAQTPLILHKQRNARFIERTNTSELKWGPDTTLPWSTPVCFILHFKEAGAKRGPGLSNTCVVHRIAPKKYRIFEL